MKFVLFAHSITSCWNHGNAHFLRGIMRALAAAGHHAIAFEPRGGWSRANLLKDHGPAAIEAFRMRFGDLSVVAYGPELDIEASIDGADVVIVHEWTEPGLIAALGRLRRKRGRFRLFFHDTHHRAISSPAGAKALALEDYDGILAFGESLAEVYRGWGWGRRAFVWHEAADTTVFRPPAREGDREGVVWIGNWGDDERTGELDRFLFGPVSQERLPLSVYGVRYPDDALDRIAALGARYGGWLPNSSVPQVFARHLCTVHVPRRFYAERLAGIPTIRMFEAMACGIPLICAPWQDREGLFREGRDYLPARNGSAVRRHLRLLRNDAAAWRALQRSGFERIRAGHSCTHRVHQLLSHLGKLDGRATSIEVVGGV